MNQAMLKAVFINLFLLVNVAGLIHSFIKVFGDGGAGWWTALLASGAVCYFLFFYIGRGKQPRTSDRVPVLLTLVSVCGFLAFVSSQGLPVFYALIGSCGGSWLYVFWYSTLDRSQSALKVGDALPELEFFDKQNNSVKTNDLQSPLLLMFYRGNWCPLCTAQIGEMAQRYRELEQRGYQVLFVSPQSQEETRKIAAKFSIPAIFCEDRDNRVSRQLGIFHARGLPLGLEAMGYDADTVMPTVVITDKQHNIIWLHETDNYRVRPEPEVFLQAIDTAMA
jgi:peroxiredoxin